jgi:hypothetical protein
MPSRPFPDPDLDYRRHPEAYRIARGEQGVLTVEPYKSEILPHWRFRTPAEAAASAKAILALYRRYRRDDDFVGMDMTRKFLQMGYTRARRYARHRSGRKYGADGLELPEDRDGEKQRSAGIFHEAWMKVLADGKYIAMKNEHQKLVRRQKRSREFVARTKKQRPHE